MENIAPALACGRAHCLHAKYNGKHMAADEVNTTSGSNTIPPAKRKMMQAWFEAGSSSSAKGNFDYATDMFTRCILGDPSNQIYAQNFLGNLQKKYNNNKKGGNLAAIRTTGPRATLKKALLQKKWEDAFSSGAEILKLNPWDKSALSDLAKACEELDYDAAQLVYLKGALDADIKDVDVNRLCGRALARQGHFDQALLCWRRVIQVKPDDEEGLRSLANLTVENTIRTGGYEEAQSSNDVAMGKTQQAAILADRPSAQLSPEQKLERAITKDPANISNYLDLSDLYNQAEKFDKAEEVLTRASQASGGDLKVLEILEDVRLRRARQQVTIAERRYQSEKTEEAKKLYDEMKRELVTREMEYYRSRCERFPNNTSYRVELGLRLQKLRNFDEAIKVLQEARSDGKRKGEVLMALGVCFEAIKRYKLAMSNYAAAITEIGEKDAELRKQALFRAGVLSMALRELDAAENYLNELAEMDYGYRDVSERLDKLAKLREDSGPSETP